MQKFRNIYAYDEILAKIAIAIILFENVEYIRFTMNIAENKLSNNVE